MWKTLMITTAVAGLMIGSATAQNGAPTGKPNPPAAAQTAPKSDSKADMATTGSTRPAQFVSTQKPDEFLASKFKGTDVIGADNKSIGSVTDILFDKSGAIKAYVVSVGGFLGIGSKDVAIAPQAFQVVSGDKSKNESDKLKIAMNADQLKQAANFQPYSPPRPVTTTGTGGTRPSPMGSPRSGS